MKILFRICLLLLCVFTLISILLLVFSISDTPEVELDWTLTHDDIVRAKKILHEGAKIKPDEITTIELSHADITLTANYLLNRYTKSAAAVSLKNNKLTFNITATLPNNRLGKYLNITIRFGIEENAPLPSITKFKAGKLMIPAKLAETFLEFGIKHSGLDNYFILATKPIKYINISSEKLTISYISSVQTLITARNVLTRTDNTPELNIYEKQIIDIIKQHDPNWRLSLAELLKPLFATAYQQSTLDTAITENRLVIMAVNDYVNKKAAKELLPITSPEAIQGKHYSAFLYKRIDLAQHFIGSAALTASGNNQVAKVLGEDKELNDAKRGSGFSFIDLAADKAGTRFGEIATSNPETAKDLQLFMSQIRDYSDFMPDPRDLPEKMTETEFIARFGSIQSPAYQTMVKSIDERIATMSLYQLDRQ